MPKPDIHDIDIRVKYLLKILHEILVLLLKCVIKNYDGQIDKADLGKGLSEILDDKNFQKLKNSLSKDGIFRERFFQLNPQTNISQLKPSIEIESLDISIMTNLINNIISKSSLKCCSKCSHKKCSCGLDTKECPKKSNCGLKDCVSCSKPFQCYLMIILKFCGVARSLRNCFAHASEDVYDKLEKGQGDLQDFPLTKTWEELWNLINDEITSCLGVLKNDPQLISIEMYEDFMMDARISFKKKIHFLIPAVDKDLYHYYCNILGVKERHKEISELSASINKLKKG